MAALGGIIAIIGYLFCAACGIWLIVVAFKDSLMWGLLTLLVPFAGLVFVFTHWAVAKKPFLLSLVGVAIAIVGVVLIGIGGAGDMQVPTPESP